MIFKTAGVYFISAYSGRREEIVGLAVVVGFQPEDNLVAGLDVERAIIIPGHSGCRHDNPDSRMLASSLPSTDMGRPNGILSPAAPQFPRNQKATAGSSGHQCLRGRLNREGDAMTPKRRGALRKEARAAWAKKTPEERRESMNGLAAEIGENAAAALREAFARAFRELSER